MLIKIKPLKFPVSVSMNKEPMVGGAIWADNAFITAGGRFKIFDVSVSSIMAELSNVKFKRNLIYTTRDGMIAFGVNEFKTIYGEIMEKPRLLFPWDVYPGSGTFKAFYQNSQIYNNVDNISADYLRLSLNSICMDEFQFDLNKSCVYMLTIMEAALKSDDFRELDKAKIVDLFKYILSTEPKLLRMEQDLIAEASDETKSSSSESSEETVQTTIKTLNGEMNIEHTKTISVRSENILDKLELSNIMDIEFKNSTKKLSYLFLSLFSLKFFVGKVRIPELFEPLDDDIVGQESIRKRNIVIYKISRFMSEVKSSNATTVSFNLDLLPDDDEELERITILTCDLSAAEKTNSGISQTLRKFRKKGTTAIRAWAITNDRNDTNLSPSMASRLINIMINDKSFAGSIFKCSQIFELPLLGPTYCLKEFKNITDLNIGKFYELV
jgi:hypothetical protein